MPKSNTNHFIELKELDFIETQMTNIINIIVDILVNIIMLIDGYFTNTEGMIISLSHPILFTPITYS